MADPAYYTENSYKRWKMRKEHGAHVEQLIAAWERLRRMLPSMISMSGWEYVSPFEVAEMHLYDVRGGKLLTHIRPDLDWDFAHADGEYKKVAMLNRIFFVPTGINLCDDCKMCGCEKCGYKGYIVRNIQIPIDRKSPLYKGGD